MPLLQKEVEMISNSYLTGDLRPIFTFNTFSFFAHMILRTIRIFGALWLWRFWLSRNTDVIFTFFPFVAISIVFAFGLEATLPIRTLETLLAFHGRTEMTWNMIAHFYSIHVTSFFNISYWNNSEYWSQKHSQSGSIHSINKMSMLQAWALNKTLFNSCERLLLGTLNWTQKLEIEASDRNTKSDLIHY